LAGFAVGVVERDRIIEQSLVRKDDVILGLASSGLHSNGYALARNICFKKNKLKLTDTFDELDGKPLADVLLEPTIIYVRPITKLLRGYKKKQIIHAMAHITGSGLIGNVPRVLPADCDALIKKSSWPRLPVFDFLEKKGPIEEKEMFNVFNMGIGFVVVVAPDFADSVTAKLEKYGQKVYRIGKVIQGAGRVVLK
jgi:phosphoribosylformylglycinamidine cyclo-ligase